jgi:hypothetical protein
MPAIERETQTDKRADSSSSPAALGSGSDPPRRSVSHRHRFAAQLRLLGVVSCSESDPRLWHARC